MKPLDVLLQRWRIAEAAPHLPPGSLVLDLGTGDAALFRQTGVRGLGLDPELTAPVAVPDGVTLLCADFLTAARDLAPASYGAVTALAVLEHVPASALPAWEQALARLLRPGGVLVATVPSPAVDGLLHVLMRLRLADGMQAHQHHGFVPADLLGVFAAPRWELAVRRRFQLGMNNLFVFRRC